MPTLYIIAGPNGVGKTTFADRYLPDEAKQLEFVNADLIARGLSQYDPELAARIEQWDESFLDVEDYQVERALTNAGLDAIRRARQFGTDFVVEEDGSAKSLKPDETAPYERRLLEDLERLNRKIAELQGQPSQSFSLNERPKK